MEDPLLLSEKSWCTSTDSIAGIAESIVLTIANLSAVPAVRVNRTGPVTMVSGVSGFAHATSRPWMTTENKSEL